MNDPIEDAANAFLDHYHFGSDDTLAHLCSVIREQAAKQWIPVTRALPAAGQFILATGPGLGNYIGGPPVDICLWDGELWNEGGTERAEADFTHWMPLPGP